MHASALPLRLLSSLFFLYTILASQDCAYSHSLNPWVNLQWHYPATVSEDLLKMDYKTVSPLIHEKCILWVLIGIPMSTHRIHFYKGETVKISGPNYPHSISQYTLASPHFVSSIMSPQ